MARDREKAAPQLRGLAEKADGFSAADKAQLWNGLLVYSRQVGDIEQARKLADLIAQGSHGDVHIQLLRFDLAKEAKDYGSMEGILAEIEKVSGRSAMWCYAKAVSLVLATRGKEK